MADRDGQGRYVKGHKGNPKGRGKGNRNKVSIQAREMVNNLLQQSFPLVVADLENMKPFERARVFCQLLDFVVPKLTRTDTSLDISKMTDQEIERLIQTILQGHE